MNIDTISFENINNWQPQGTVVAFMGAEAAFHASIHNAVMEKISLRKPDLSNWYTVIIETNESNFAETLKILHAKHVWGVVFTAPLKNLALRIISPVFQNNQRGAITPTDDMLMGIGSAEAIADRIGAINLAQWRPNGYWGLSTDGESFVRAFFDGLKTKLKGKTVVVLGAGAFGKAVAVEALTRGCRELWIGNRTQEHTWDAIDQILPSANMRARVHSFNLAKPSPKVPKSGIIINTLPLGARQAGISGLEIDKFDRTSIYFDTALVATPEVKAAEARQMPLGMGKRLFARQVCRHIELLTGTAPALEVVVWVVNEAAQKL